MRLRVNLSDSHLLNTFFDPFSAPALLLQLCNTPAPATPALPPAATATVTLLMNLLLLLWTLVGGFLVNPASMHPALAWLR